MDVHQDPARGVIDGNEHVATRGLIGHLRKVIDIDVERARLVVFKRLLQCDRFALNLRNYMHQARHAFALEQARDVGAGHVGTDVLRCTEQQVVERQVVRLTKCKTMTSWAVLNGVHNVCAR